jgi:hypothetical protein
MQLAVTTCPTPGCGAEVVECGNKVRLDYPAQPWDGARYTWALMPLGGGSDSVWATNGDPDANGNAHSLHEHQPEGGMFA